MQREPSRPGRFVYALYDAVGAVAAVLAVPLAPVWLWYGHGNGLTQRLGLSQAQLARGLRARPVWVHAASVGEVRAARLLIAELRRRQPQLPVVVSTTTVTGRAVAETDIAPDLATLLPIDPLRTIDRVLRAVHPRCLVVVETEIWPGLFRAADRLAIPIVVVSGRISPRSVARYQRVAPLLRAALGCVASFGMQTTADAERMIALGAPRVRVHVTGTLKASALPEANPNLDMPPLAGLTTRPLLVAASTQPGEEQFVLDACAPLWSRHPGALLLVAPRRPERFAEAEASLQRAGLSYERRTAMEGAVRPTTQVILLDTLGELVRFLPFATAVFVGGTVTPLGGHNLWEPATFGKVVAFGPNTENVAEAASALQATGGGVMVAAPADLTTLWARCLDDPAVAQELGARAQAAAAAGRGTLERTWELLEPYLGDE